MPTDGTSTMQFCQKKLDLEFRGISFESQAKRGQKSRTILDGANGKFRSGRLTAVLGPSGAGKTSLMNVLSGFRVSNVTGSVRVNGVERIPQSFRKECCYITQEFAMLPLLTVYETMKTTADLKLGNTISYEKKLSVLVVVGLIFVDALLCHIIRLSPMVLYQKRLPRQVHAVTNRNLVASIFAPNPFIPAMTPKDYPDITPSVIREITEILSITSCFHTQVRYLSGGEKKRLSIGLELITNPPIMFFDEPTSGLDSSSSIQVISHLRTLARGGRTIVCVIHQPSSRLFQMFDDVFILVDGKTLFNGSADELVPVFDMAGFQCPNYYNRADFAIEVACREKGVDLEPLFSLASSRFARIIQEAAEENRNTTAENASIPQLEVLEPMLPGSLKYPKSTNIQILPLGKPNAGGVIGKLCCSTAPYPTSVWLQFWILLKRSFLCSCIRDLHMAQIRFVAQVVVGILMGTVFYNFGNDAAKVTSNMSFLFFSLMFIFFSNSMPTVQTFPSEAAVFFREHLNSWYSTRAYYFSKLVADLPLQIICPITYLTITYFMTNQLLETDRLLKVLLLGVLVTMMAQALGHAFGAAFDAQLGTFLIPASAIPMFLFSGFFIKLSELPNSLKWISYLSYFRYPYEGMMIAVYGGERKNLNCTGYCMFRVPHKLLESMDLKESNYWLDIAGLAGWIIVLRLAFFGVLKWKLYRKRGY